MSTREGRSVDPIVNEFLNSHDWKWSEKLVIQWQFRLLGHFRTALFEAITRADEDNLDRIRHGFPNEIDGFRAWNRGDLARRLRGAGLDI